MFYTIILMKRLLPLLISFLSPGTHSSLAGNSKALATVTAIIDGTGSIGMAPFLPPSLPPATSDRTVFSK